MFSFLLPLCTSFVAPRTHFVKARSRTAEIGRSARYDEDDDDDFYDDVDDRMFGNDKGRRRTKVLDDIDDDEEDQDEPMEGIIPNPLLDNIDPEGAFGRMDELLTDGKFWRDLCILLLLLNFLDNVVVYDDSPFDFFFGRN